MKKIITILSVFVSLSCFSQNEVVTITPQARDLEYIASFIYNDNASENLYDSMKVKFRVQNPPTGTTTVSVTGVASDWALIIQALKKDHVAVAASVTSRVETLLRAASVSWLTARVDEVDAFIVNSAQDRRAFGRNRLRRL